MHIGLYGLPCAGKTTILNRINFMPVYSGSRLLRRLNSDFDHLSEVGKEVVRKEAASSMRDVSDFIMDGHYSFGNKVAFTNEEGGMYDVYLYLYISPEIIKHRMNASEKNKIYADFDIEAWQNKEIDELCAYCHANNKDFYVIDNPPEFDSPNIATVIRFIKDILNGYSCVSFARECANHIIDTSNNNEIRLFDGDKTISVKDTSNLYFGYKTHLYDGNFYTGYQSWLQGKDFSNLNMIRMNNLPELNDTVVQAITANSYILTSGLGSVWERIAKELNAECFYGAQMSAETKYFITKFLQEAGKRVVAYGDGMNDYFMLQTADEGYLVTKQDGSISRSLKNRTLEGIIYV